MAFGQGDEGSRPQRLTAKIGDEGLERLSKPHYTSAILKRHGAKSGAPTIADPDLASIFDAWPTLSNAIKAGILAMVRASK
jgi:hypothetical protein